MQSESPRDLVADHDGVVVLLVPGAVDEGDGAPRRAPRKVIQPFASSRSPQLPAIAVDEPFPPARVVAEPAAEVAARRQLPRPNVERERLLLDTARPEPVDQDPVAVAPRRRLVGALDLDHRSAQATCLSQRCSLVVVGLGTRPTCPTCSPRVA